MATRMPPVSEEDPDRTDVLPALQEGADAFDDAAAETGVAPGPDPEVVVAEDPTLIAPGLEATQPRLPQLPPPDEALQARLAEECARSEALSGALDESRATIASLEDRQARLAAELEALRQLVPAGQLAPLRAELELLQAAAAEHEAERYGWREARDAAFADVKRLSAELAASDAALTTARREHAAASGALIRARTALAEREAEIAGLRERLAGSLAAAPEPAAVPSLIPLAGTQCGVVRLGLRTRIGRADDNELALDVASVSRHHAIIIASARGVFVEDLNSANGLYVNRRRVRQARLADGDVVAFGGATFRYSGPFTAAG